MSYKALRGTRGIVTSTTGAARAADELGAGRGPGQLDIVAGKTDDQLHKPASSRRSGAITPASVTKLVTSRDSVTSKAGLYTG